LPDTFGRSDLPDHAIRFLPITRIIGGDEFNSS
jgi:hypothetical protein